MTRAHVLIVLMMACNLESSLQTPDGPTPDDAAVDPDTPPVDRVVQLATGAGVSCAVKESGSLLCWGANDQGQLGVPATEITTMCTHDSRTAPCRSTPTIIPGIDQVATVAVGQFHVCAAKKDGTVWCWGNNDDGQLGHDPTVDAACPFSAGKCSSTPTQVNGVAGVDQIALGLRTTCARTTAGALLCWGQNSNALLGNGTTSGSTHVPATPIGLSTLVTKVASARIAHAMCALKGAEVFCWGLNFPEGNLGHDPSTDANTCGGQKCAPTPTKVLNLGNVIDVAVGERAVCVVVLGGTIRCWGSNLIGQLGAGSTSEPSGPAIRTVTGIAQGASTSGSFTTSCANTADGELFCWGSVIGVGDGNFDGGACVLGPCEATPVKSSVTAPIDLYSIGTASLARDASGTFFGWGENGFGEAGHDPGTAGDITTAAGRFNATPTAFAIP